MMKTKPKKSHRPYILPYVPSQLIDIALEDLEKCEKSNRYQICMSVWHVKNSRTCSVCAAGAVMAKRLNTTKDSMCPSDFPGNKDQLKAIDCLRCGLVAEACEQLGVLRQQALSEFYDIADYKESPEHFKRDLRRLAEILKGVGL